MKKMNKKGNVFQYLVAGLLGAASFTFILIFVILMISTTKNTDIVKNDGNATNAINKVQTAINIVPDFMQIIIIAIIFAGLLALLVMGGIWGYQKMQK